MDDSPVLDLRDRALSALDRGDVESALELARAASAAGNSAALHPSNAGKTTPRRGRANIGWSLDRAACLVALAEIEEALRLCDAARRSLEEALALLDGAAPLLDLSLAARSKAAAAMTQRDEHDRMQLWCQASERLANLHSLDGHFERAVGMLEQVLTMASSKFGEASLLVVHAANSLGVVHEKAGDLAAAAEAFARAMKAMRHTPEADELTRAAIVHNIAALAHRRGDTLTGVPLAEEALRLRRQALGNDHPDVADDIATLAALYHLDGRHDSARDAYQQALALLQGHLEPGDARIGLLLGSLAALSDEAGAPAQAEITGRRALQILEGALGPEDVEVGLTLLNLSSCVWRQGRRHEAALLAGRAGRILTSRLPCGHPYLVAAANTLAAVDLPPIPDE